MVPQDDGPVKRQRITASQAAELLGKDRKTLFRWRKTVPGCPFGEDGTVDPVELQEWVRANGLLERPAHRAPDAERLAPAGSSAAGSAEPTAKPAPSSPWAAAELSAEDEEALKAIVAGDADRLVELAAKVDPLLLKRLAVMGRTRRELAEAERRELENREHRGELVPIADVKRFWLAQIEIVKSHFQALPGKLASRLVQKDYDQVYEVLDEELRALLAAFAVETGSLAR